MSPFTGDLIQKYFDVQRVYNPSKGRHEHIIQGYDDCPIWVLCEVLTFGEFLRLYDFYYGNTAAVSGAILGLVRCLRNGSAHNNVYWQIYHTVHQNLRVRLKIMLKRWDL